MEKYLGKRHRILKVVAIASIGFGLGMLLHLKLETDPPNQPAPEKQALSSADAIAPIQQPAKTLPIAFPVPAKFAGKTFYDVKLDNKEKVVTLTIDDGPQVPETPQFLDILKSHNVKATFFVVGKAVEAHPEIFQRIVAEGHAIGNHTWHHRYRRMSRATARSEIERTAEIIHKTTGVKTEFFRPPGGFLNNGLAAYAKSQKQAVVMWSVTTADTDPRAKPEAFVNNVLKSTKPGSIILMHDGGGDRSRSVKALPGIISGLKQKGYRFVTLPELLEMSSR
ncbi:polysaccharide deacetylase family protein [Microseira wollei]|uniref:Polysaccharide deacetylase n=1 Tax=Microseira wollei NIES-4236 TaxID=2530354 RepID=A0AAV3XHV4_9CYAN|nr:polysaccharide deacetylase family protein [Microseira wollei]GET40012.1 polysaccharide deacetylase [Microseira wollei NIES-4236]